MFQELLNMFHTSQQGQSAMGVLQQQGWAPEQIQTIMGNAMPAAANAMHSATAGHAEPALGLFNIFGGHAGGEFLTGAITGLIRGDGFIGSLEDGAMGAIGGHIAEVLAQRTGMNQQMAGQVAALLTPFIVHYAHEKLRSHPAVTQQLGNGPGGFAPQFAPQQQGGFAPMGGGFNPQQGGGFNPQQGGGFNPQQGGGFNPQQGGGFDKGGYGDGGHHHHHHHHHHDKDSKG